MAGISRLGKWSTELGKHWDLGGTLWNIRNGDFDQSGLELLEAQLREVDFGNAGTLSRGLVSLLWYIPLVLIWNSDRLDDRNKLILDSHTERIINELHRVLGSPSQLVADLRTAGVDEILQEWNSEQGFLRQVAIGKVDPLAARRFREELSAIQSAEAQDNLGRDLVTAVWSIPLFFEQQLRLNKPVLKDPDALLRLKQVGDAAQEAVSGILGIP